jgi:SAM domain (Sterile alpha motif)
MQQIADWLEKLGLGQYAQRFAENDVSFAVLPDLTDQDLKELGVSLLVTGVSFCARSSNSATSRRQLCPRDHSRRRRMRQHKLARPRKQPASAAT